MVHVVDVGPVGELLSRVPSQWRPVVLPVLAQNLYSPYGRPLWAMAPVELVVSMRAVVLHPSSLTLTSPALTAVPGLASLVPLMTFTLTGGSGTVTAVLLAGSTATSTGAWPYFEGRFASQVPA